MDKGELVRYMAKDANRKKDFKNMHSFWKSVHIIKQSK